MIVRKPALARSVYLKRAALIAAALVVAFACLAYWQWHDGSLLLLLTAEVVLVVACGTAMMGVLNVASAVLGSFEGIFVILGFGLLILAIPFLAPVFLVWNLVQAARASTVAPESRPAAD